MTEPDTGSGRYDHTAGLLVLAWFCKCPWHQQVPLASASALGVSKCPWHQQLPLASDHSQPPPGLAHCVMHFAKQMDPVPLAEWSFEY